MSSKNDTHQGSGKSANRNKSHLHAAKNEMRERLRSEEGYTLSIRRMIEPESVFGQLKNNRGFRRFLLRGLQKVSLEVGWLCLAHNLLKKVALTEKRKKDKEDKLLLCPFWTYWYYISSPMCVFRGF
ncbi:transposase [Paenibacillus sp. RRE4]|nr:transposase [Paenibacillus sp. RRE4]MDT0126150.1 transposase [Paenibacillus sp. RRE4]